MFILEALEHYAKTDRIAIRYHDEQVRFAALDRMADAFAAFSAARFRTTAGRS